MYRTRKPLTESVAGRTSRVLAMVLAASLVTGPLLAGQSGADTAEIDEFMKQVLQRRNANWEDLYRHTVRDRETLKISGPGGLVIESYENEAVWYVREGFMVRSPERMNGVAVSGEEQEAAEQRFLKRARERVEKREQADAEGGQNPEREHFLGFPYEPGRYLLAGREAIGGRETLKIEYYPVELFEDDSEEPSEEDLRWRDRFSKTSRITLWVIPDEHQIVKVEYDNVGLEFLPMRWLVQVDDLRGTMTMIRPFPDEDVWLPQTIRIHGRVSMATGTLSLDYTTEYFDYAEADVQATVRYRLPGEQQQRER